MSLESQEVRISTLTTSVRHITGSLAKVVRQEERNKRFILFTDEMLLYLDNSKDYMHTQKKLLEVLNEFRKVTGYKINMQKSAAFLI